MRRLRTMLVLLVALATVPAFAHAASSVRPAHHTLKPGAGKTVDRLQVTLSPRKPVKLTSKTIPATANVELEVLVDHKTVGVAETEELVACGGTNNVAVRVVSKSARAPATVYAISLNGKHTLTVVLSWTG